VSSLDALAVPQGGAEAAEETRRRLTTRQAAVVDRLVRAAADEARQRGYEEFTVRRAARRAGVAPATAYTYFASKDHLLAEVLWRRLDAVERPPSTAGDDALTRITDALRTLGLFIADDPLLAEACTTALLGRGPDVRALRARFGAEFHRRLADALGPDATPSLLLGLDLAYTGAMLWAGLGHLPYAAVPDALAEVARNLLGAEAS